MRSKGGNELVRLVRSISGGTEPATHEDIVPVSIYWLHNNGSSGPVLDGLASPEASCRVSAFNTHMMVHALTIIKGRN